MKRKTKTLIGIVRNEIESAIFLYFNDNTIYRLDCDLNMTTDEEAINYYSKWSDILDRDQKIKTAINKLKGI